MATPSAIPTNSLRDTVQCIHRVTRENRHLWYQMTVLQQPERARACGSGMKANSDRRPVDPPPVVELRIIEGPSVEEGKDITFDYNANFFLYASLEHARPLAHGRVQTPQAANPPILTGVPASGMAYLDRPAEAGYFIFPDLSVRHEGLYRLSFSLFETTKQEKDFDLEPAEADLPLGVDWRMEIKTAPFNVFSAKKFPGLMESTQLSKTVADQGCRVRIRRDVRMRKREGKGRSYERRGEDEYVRPRTVTPAPEDPHGLRARSLSSSSEHRVPYGPEPQRRPSVVEAYPPPPPPPPPPSAYEAAPSAPRGHLSFGDPAASQYAAPPPQYTHQGPALNPISPGGPYGATPTHSPYIKAESKPFTYHQPRPLPPASPSPAQSMRHEAGHDRRSSGNYPPPSPSLYSPADSYSRRDSQASYPATPSALQLPPPSRSQHSLAPLKISSLMAPLPPIEPQTEPLPPPPIMSTGGKRKHDHVFSQSTRPLFNGQRQVDAHYGISRRGLTPEPYQATYVRAGGEVVGLPFGTFQP